MSAPACPHCGFPVDPGASCARCGASPAAAGNLASSESLAATVRGMPAWAVGDAGQPAPAEPAPPITPPGMRSAGIAFDRAHTLARTGVSVRAERWRLAAGIAIDVAAVGAAAAGVLAAGACAFGLSALKAEGAGSAIRGAAHVATASHESAVAVALLVSGLAAGYTVLSILLLGRTPGVARLAPRRTSR